MSIYQANWGVVGHDWAVALLRSSLSAGRAAHAYLLSGPPQIGKRTLAMFRQPYMQWENCPSNWAEKYQDYVRSRYSA